MAEFNTMFTSESRSVYTRDLKLQKLNELGINRYVAKKIKKSKMLIIQKDFALLGTIKMEKE